MDIRTALDRFYVSCLISEYRESSLPSDYDDLDYVDITILEIIHYREGCTAGWLAGILGLTKSAMTKKIDSMESRGLVERVRDPEDSRRKILKLTEFAEITTNRIDRPFNEALDAMEEQLTPEENAAVVKALTIMIEHLEKEHDL